MKEKKQRIINAFIDIASQQSLGKITLKEVAKYCGISISLISYHFKNKKELIRETSKYIFRQYIPIINDVFKEIEQYIHLIPKNQLKNKKNRVKVALYLTDLISNTIFEYFSSNDKNLRFLSLLSVEYSTNNDLGHLQRIPHRILKTRIQQLMQLIHSPYPQEDALILLCVVEHLQTQTLFNKPSSLIDIHKAIWRILSNTLKIDIDYPTAKRDISTESKTSYEKLNDQRQLFS